MLPKSRRMHNVCGRGGVSHRCQRHPSGTKAKSFISGICCIRRGGKPWPKDFNPEKRRAMAALAMALVCFTGDPKGLIRDGLLYSQADSLTGEGLVTGAAQRFADESRAPRAGTAQAQPPSCAGHPILWVPTRPSFRRCSARSHPHAAASHNHGA